MTDESVMIPLEPCMDEPARKRLLRERALELAQPVDWGGVPGDEMDFIVFTLAGEFYGIEAGCVRQVGSAADLLPLPCTPPFVAGILSVRGEVVAVLDIKVFLEIPVEGMIQARQAILIEVRDMTFGILADSVVGLRAISAKVLQPPSQAVAGLRMEYIKGIASEVLVLDTDRIAADRRLIVNEEVEDEVIG